MSTGWAFRNVKFHFPIVYVFLELTYLIVTFIPKYVSVAMTNLLNSHSPYLLHMTTYTHWYNFTCKWRSPQWFAWLNEPTTLIMRFMFPFAFIAIIKKYPPHLRMGPLSCTVSMPNYLHVTYLTNTYIWMVC